MNKYQRLTDGWVPLMGKASHGIYRFRENTATYPQTTGLRHHQEKQESSMENMHVQMSLVENTKVNNAKPEF